MDPGLGPEGRRFESLDSLYALMVDWQLFSNDNPISLFP